MRWLIAFITLIALLCLTGCNDKPDAADYFPLNEGLSWEYRVTNTTKPGQEVYRVTNVGTTEIVGETATIRRTNDGRDYYLVRKADGVYRYATRTLFEGEPVVDASPRMVLPIPYDDTKKRWSAKTVSYVIHRTGPPTITNEDQPIQDFLMHYRVVATDETVTVPAGWFEGCLLVEGVATLNMFADPLTGFEDVPITTREWYAPGVGLVRLERKEPLKTRVFEGGSYLFELVGN